MLILKKETIKNLYGQTALFRMLMDECNVVNMETIRRWIRANKPNGPLTAITTLEIIAEITKIPLELLTEQYNETPNPKPERNRNPEPALP